MSTLASTIITDVRRELLEATGITWSDTELLRLLNRGEIDFVNKTRCLESISTISLSIGVSSYPLPSDYLGIRLVLHNHPDVNGNNDWRRIYPSNLEKIAQEQPNLLDDTTATQARPVKYFIWNRTLYIKPTPDVTNATIISIWYKSKPIPLTSTSQNINIDDALSEALNEYILWKALKKVKEDDIAAEHHSQYLAMIGEGRRWVKKESSDQRFRIDIDSPIPFIGGIPGFNPLRP